MAAADEVIRIIGAFVGPDPPLSVCCWDGSVAGDPGAPLEIRVESPTALRRLLYAPNELGLARAHVAGEIEFEGSIFDLLALRELIAGRDRDVYLHLGWRQWLDLIRSAARLGALGPPPPPPPEEARLRGRLHSPRRDRAAISHHYDVGNEFYELVLGQSMTYSCAYFADDRVGLEDAQSAKHELVCRKLGLGSGMRLLDVGCGWGSMAIHAAQHHDVGVVGITISQEQYDLASKRVTEAGLVGRVDIRLLDYREIDDGPYDAISSIGMFEHVGAQQMRRYLGRLRDLVRPGGRIMNHAISRPSGEGPFDEKGFPARYVFPDGQLHEVGRVVSSAQDLGLECRDVESLREHYALTLRAWVDNLERQWEEAVELVGAPRARIWRLYMAGSALGFEANRLSVHQALFVRPDRSGASSMPATRAGFLVP